MTNPKTATITVESEPHDLDLTGTILNRPLPNNGAFLIRERLPRDVWNALKAAGAWYLSAEDLEDFDMFQSEPGWRYPIQALAALIGQGYALAIRGETITTEEQLQGLFTAEAKAAYRERVAQEQAAAKQAEQDRKARIEADRAVRGASYAIWQRVFLDGLVATSIGPDYTAGHYGVGGPWELVYRAEKGTPGAWYDTGDQWYRSTTTGVLRRDYGNASRWYGPQDVVDGWVLACDDGSVAYARHVLIYHGYGVHGSDAADRLVELRGLEHYLERARSEEWIIRAGNYSSREVDVIAHYGITPVVVEIHTLPSSASYREHVARIGSVIGQWQRGDRQRNYTALAQAADGRWFATTDQYNGGDWRALTTNECQALGLDLTPPAQPPVQPPAKPLPSAEETEERSRRFSEMFSG